MANKKTKASKKTKNPELYYFHSVGCGFCKRVEPIVDELIKEGHNILKLDTAEADNQGLNREYVSKQAKNTARRGVAPEWGAPVMMPPRDKSGQFLASLQMGLGIASSVMSLGTTSLSGAASGNTLFKMMGIG